MYVCVLFTTVSTSNLQCVSLYVEWFSDLLQNLFCNFISIKTLNEIKEMHSITGEPTYHSVVSGLFAGQPGVNSWKGQKIFII
jgi:hypothetical protein